MSGVLVVTGSSRGIGAACAKLGAARGYKVCVNYNSSPDRAEAVVAEVTAAGGQAIAVGGDMGREADIVGLFEEVDKSLGPVTALINNAGMAGGVGRLENMAEAELAEIFRLNLIGPFICSREAVRRMSTNCGGAGGVIVNISSTAARLGAANYLLHYATSKGGLDTFSVGLGLEVAEEGIRVVGLRPGVIDTEFHAGVGAPDRATDQASVIPLGRAGRVEEIAKAALWLLSDEASYITATSIDVGGGR